MTDSTRDHQRSLPESTEQLDDVRRKLLRAAALSGAGLTLGQIPYTAPAIKSFFGTRVAWAQATGPLCGVVVVNARPTQDGPTADFEVTNTGTEAFDLTEINSSNPEFIVVTPSLPVTINPGSSVNGSVELVCSMVGQQQTTLSFVAQTASGSVDCPTLDITRECILACAVEPTMLEITDNMCDQGGSTGVFTIHNTGNIPFSVDQLNIVTNDPPFSDTWQVLAPTTPVELQPDTSVDVEVSYDCCESEGGFATVEIVTSSELGPVTCTEVMVTGVCTFNDN